MFPIIEVDRASEVATEELGTKSKFWFYADEHRRMLFKGEDRNTGEDWAEKVACCLCELLGLPHVHYDLAALFEGDRRVRYGVVCESCAPAPVELVLGNQLLLHANPQYPANEPRKYKVRAHTIDAVAEAVRGLAPPAGSWMSKAPTAIHSAMDVFVGYVLLDAWIANQDRHHENWAALSGDELRLAPTFDHGAALARNITDGERQDRLTTGDRNRGIAVFATKARSAFFATETDTRPLGTLEAFGAFAYFAPDAAKTWLARLAAVQRTDLEAILAQVPAERMSDTAKDFTLELMTVNQQRLLSEGVKG